MINFRVSRLVRCGCPLALALPLALPAAGVPLFWNGSTGTWGGGSVNWLLENGEGSGQTPTAVDVVTIDGGNVTVVFPGSQSSSLVLGENNTANLSLYSPFQNSTLTTGTGGAFIGNGATSIGTVTVNGARFNQFTGGATWTNLGGLFLGNLGSGTLIVELDGHVTNTNAILGADAGSNGTATVHGFGSTWDSSGFLIVGGFGNGTVNIQAGGSVTSGPGNIGRHAGSTGMITVTALDRPGSIPTVWPWATKAPARSTSELAAASTTSQEMSALLPGQPA